MKIQNQSEIKKLTSDWVSTSLGELSQYVTSGSRDWKKYYSNTGALFIRTQDINKNRLTLERTARVELPNKVEGKRTRVHKGDLLITITGANVGKVALVDNDIEEAYVSQSVALVRLKNKDLGRYVHHHLMVSEGAHTYLETAAYGMGRPVLNLKNVREAPIRLAPKEQRESIVAEIEKQFSRLKEAVTSLKRAKANLKRYKAAVLKAAVEGNLTEEWRKQHPDVEPASELLKRILAERRRKWEEDELDKMLTNSREPRNDEWKKKYKHPNEPGEENTDSLPDGWCLVTWDQISNWVTYGFTRPMPHVEEGQPIVTAKNVINGSIDIINTHKTPAESFNELSDKDRPQENDILITKDGTIGRAAVVPKLGSFCINQSVAVVWLRSSPMNRRFLLAVIESDLVQKPINAKARGVAIRHLSITDFAKMTFPMPPLDEQEILVDEVEMRLSAIKGAEAEIEINMKRVDSLRSCILRKAYEGKLIS